MTPMTDELLLERAQEVINAGHAFLRLFDTFNKDMEPYMDRISSLMEVDERFDDMEDKFIVLMQRLTVR
jgi:hypothetical protein